MESLQLALHPPRQAAQAALDAPSFLAHSNPSPLLIATGEAIPLRGLEGVPGLPGAPQDEAGLTRKFETWKRP